MNQTQTNPEQSKLSRRLTPDALLGILTAMDAVSHDLLARYFERQVVEYLDAKDRGVKPPESNVQERVASYAFTIFSATFNTARIALESGDPEILRALAKSVDDWLGQQKDYGGRDMSQVQENPLLFPPEPTKQPNGPTTNPSVN